MLECLIGLVESQTIDKDRAFKNFEEWELAKFGAGVEKHFMNPYNFKVWATPLMEIGYYSIAERVSVVDGARPSRRLSPRRPPTGARTRSSDTRCTAARSVYWKGVLPFLGDRVGYHKRAIGVDEEKREIEYSDGTTRQYDKLLTTLPLEAFVSRLKHRRSRARGLAEVAVQPALFGRRGPEAPVALGQELDLLPEPEDAVLPDDVPLQLLARDRAGR